MNGGRNGFRMLVRAALGAAILLAAHQANAQPIDPSYVSGLDLWLRADAGVTTTGGSVSQWLDQSSDNRHATQGSASRQPQHMPGALNGLPAVSFDGADDHLNLATNTASGTVLIVNRVDPGAKFLAGIIGRDGADKGVRRDPGDDQRWRHPGDGNDFTNPAGSQFQVNGAPTDLAPEGSWHTLTAVRNGSTQAHNSLGGYFSGREFSGDIAEVAVYDHALSGSEHALVGSQLAGKYDLPYDLSLQGVTYWLKSDAGVTTSGSDVTNWADQSGNGLDFSQGTTNKQPDLVAGALGGNGLPGIRFDGDRTSGGAGADELVMNSSTTPRTVFIVNNTLSHQGLDGAWGLEGGDKGLRRASSNAWQHPGTDPNPFTNPDGLMFVNGAATNVAPDGTDHILAATKGSNHQGTYGATSLGDYFDHPIAGSRAWNGELGEVILFDRVLNAAEIQIVENYLSARFSIPMAANDRYAGDDPGNGDYDLDVFGIGRTDSSNQLQALAGRSGLALFEDNATLGDGEWLLAGHNSPTNSFINVNEGNAFERMERVWYVDKTAVDGLDAVFAFDLSDAGLLPSASASKFIQLIYSPHNAFEFVGLDIEPTLIGDQVYFAVPDAQLRDGYYTIGYTPEPGTLSLLGLGALGLWRRRRSAART